MEKIAQLLIDAVEELGIERRCVSRDETWEIKHLTNDY